jgi:hypothetical protein
VLVLGTHPTESGFLKTLYYLSRKSSENSIVMCVEEIVFCMQHGKCCNNYEHKKNRWPEYKNQCNHEQSVILEKKNDLCITLRVLVRCMHSKAQHIMIVLGECVKNKITTLEPNQVYDNDYTITISSKPIQVYDQSIWYDIIRFEITNRQPYLKHIT